MDTDSDRFLRLPTFLIDRPIKKEWSGVKKSENEILVASTMGWILAREKLFRNIPFCIA
jgi:hypothetical protein